MPQFRLGPDDRRLMEVLQQLSRRVGWTIADQAEAMGLSPQTVRGVPFGKDRAGPHVLGRVFALMLEMKAQMGTSASDDHR